MGGWSISAPRKIRRGALDAYLRDLAAAGYAETPRGNGCLIYATADGANEVLIEERSARLFTVTRCQRVEEAG